MKPAYNWKPGSNQLMVILRTPEEGCQGRRVGLLPFSVISGNPLDALIADARALCQKEGPQQARLDTVGTRVLRAEAVCFSVYKEVMVNGRRPTEHGIQAPSEAVDRRMAAPMVGRR